MDEHVLEAELDVVGQLARRFPANEVARLEDRERIVDALQRADRAQDVSPERLADDRGREKRRARVVGDRVDARCDRLANGHRERVRVATFGDGGRELFEEERVSFGDFDQAPDIQTPFPSDELARKLGRRGFGKRVENDRRLRDEPATPPGPRV